MECEDDEYVRSEAAAVDGSLGVKRRRHGAESNLQLDVTIAMPSASHGKPMHSRIVPPLEINCQKVIFTNTPFMNNMDEIFYWVHTKRAPCLYTYDQINIKHKEQAHCSNLKPKNNVLAEVPSPKKRNKRKLISVEDDTVSTEHEPAVNIFTCNGRRKPTKNNGIVSSIGSDIDFIIKDSSTEIKPKRMRLERKSKADITQKHTNKFASSTPKAGTLRRSLRKLQKTLDNSHLESTMENLNNNTTLGSTLPENITQDGFTKPSENNHINANEIIVVNKNYDNLNNKSKHEMIPNGQFEDVSDVSGFTANYIRSTKLHSNKSSRNIRNKLKKTNMKQISDKQGSKTVMCVNKSINTGLADSAVLNCSTDSSQNIINVVTLKTNEKLARVNRATSLLKFVDTKPSDSKESLTNIDIKDLSTANVSVQSNGTSRYPKRHKNNMTDEMASVPSRIKQSKCASGRRKQTCKNSSECNNSDRKENPEEEFVTRTRSGRKIGLKVRQTENTVLVLSNSTELLSSMTAVNVAGPAENKASDDSNKKTRRSCRAVQVKKSADRSRQALRKDSLKEKSGFSACFSESDEDVKPVKQGKFFC